MDTSGPSAPTPAPFAAAPALAAFLAPLEAYLAAAGPDAADRLVVGAAVVVVGGARRPQEPRLLLVRRSRHDAGGGCWETPGGLCEAGRDGSVLAAAARELREEAGLAARRFAARVAAPHAWLDGGARWRKLTFLVEVEAAAAAAAAAADDDNDDAALPAVRLDPAEHDDYVWASEREVRAGRAGRRVFAWIAEDQRAVVLEAFALARRLGEEKDAVRGAGEDGQGHIHMDTSSE